MKLYTDLLIALSGGESPYHNRLFVGKRRVRADS
jgi:hypothetical protein